MLCHGIGPSSGWSEMTSRNASVAATLSRRVPTTTPTAAVGWSPRAGPPPSRMNSAKPHWST